ncbi:uncharacterized protein LOC107038171 [Diachasma alloeum]|uniref:uncharacterized protein LOC107038171 n=1 Tax=Diachasma alloeum TaxID=454923 RepID=UPI0007384A85|nr:uncharacterized protein LOC107038171 [Diachasma alloeum]
MLRKGGCACHSRGIWGTDWTDTTGSQCDNAIRETIQEDRATIVDDTPDRLHSTWLSQECEVRAGPEYVIRKYTFFENGTYLLIRHHYAEESCSVATHTVVARGVIRILSSSGLAPGAAEASYQLERVHIVPLTRQVAHKFAHRVNVTCTPQPRWRPYVPQIIYEQPPKRMSKFNWEGPTFNSFQRPIPSRKHGVLNCLEALGIDFNELRLVRVQKKPSTSTAFGLGSNGEPKVELFLGSLPPNIYLRKSHRSTSLQPTALLRADTIKGCLVCSAISRGTENSPPLLHEVAALPALLGGSWISSNCESCEGGLWIKRQLTVFSGDLLWTGRWEYYTDPKCTKFIYAVTAAGSYVQRAGRLRRHELSERDFIEPKETVFSYPIEEILNSEPTDSDSKTENTKRFKRNADQLQPKNFQMKKRDFSPWIKPEMAKKLLDIYEEDRSLSAAMIPRINFEEAVVEPKTETTSTTTSTTTTTTERQTERRKLEETTESLADMAVRRTLSSDDSYRHLLRRTHPSLAESFATMLRGNQRREETTAKPFVSPIPTGTTELDLHVAESQLIAGDLSIAARCGAQIVSDGSGGLRVEPLSSWPRNCVRHALEAPSTLGLRARVGVSWSGQYTLLVGPRDDNLWEAPLRQCGRTPSHNSALRAHLRQSLGHRYGLLRSSGGRLSATGNFRLLLIAMAAQLVVRCAGHWRRG